MSPKRLPSATYRVQLNQDFRFADVLKILDYLHELGISDLYLSPVLASRKGSGHGYEVTDRTGINPELGTEEEVQQRHADECEEEPQRHPDDVLRQDHPEGGRGGRGGDDGEQEDRERHRASLVARE